MTLSLIATQVKHEHGHKSKHNASIIIRMSIEALICTGHDGRDISINIRRTQGFEILVFKFMLRSRPSSLAHKLLMHFCYKPFEIFCGDETEKWYEVQSKKKAATCRHLL